MEINLKQTCSFVFHFVLWLHILVTPAKYLYSTFLPNPKIVRHPIWTHPTQLETSRDFADPAPRFFSIFVRHTKPPTQSQRCKRAKNANPQPTRPSGRNFYQIHLKHQQKQLTTAAHIVLAIFMAVSPNFDLLYETTN